MQVIVTQDSAPNDNFLIGFRFIPLPPLPDPLEMLNPQEVLFPSILLKFNIVWGGSGEFASFTSITGKVPTLFTSIVVLLCEFPLNCVLAQSLLLSRIDGC